MGLDLSRLIRSLFILLILSLVVVGSAIFVILLLPPIHEDIRVPDVVGKDFEAAFDILTNHNLRLKKISRYCDVVPEGYVIKQSPSPGRKVRKGRRITLVVSKGKAYLFVPDVKGMTLPLARNAIHRAGGPFGEGALRIGYIAHVHSEEVKEGVVMAQSPFAMTRVARGTGVNLLISLGPWPKEFEMPNLKGMEVEGALERAKTLGLIVARIEEVETHHIERLVIAQSPSPGYTVQEGDLVSLRISKGIGWEADLSQPRFETIRFIVPKGLYYKQIQFIVIDKEGEREIYNQKNRPGELLEIPTRIVGEGKVKIFVDGELYVERAL
jgi:serine/threonine-protein kinase